MSFVRIKIHAVWGTKNREPYLNKELRSIVTKHIIENAKLKGLQIDIINGYFDHLHCLFALNADMSISKAIQLIKGESAYWINKEGITNFKFEWADEYFAESVSEKMISQVRTYIKNQVEHHKNLSFGDEYDCLIGKGRFTNVD